MKRTLGLKVPGFKKGWSATLGYVFVYLTCCIAFVIPSGCGSFDLGAEPPTEINVNAENPEWAADIQFIMQVKCMNCHAEPRPKRAPTKTPVIPLDSQKVFDSKATRLLSIVVNQNVDAKQFMPPNFATPLSSLEKLALKNYICNPSKVPDADGSIKGACTAASNKPPVDNNPSKPGSALSVNFGASCTCHGPTGKEKVAGTFVIAGTKLTLEEFKNFVRSGRNTMPQFAPAAYSDQVLETDYNFLKANP
jgi:hypothetical protein